MQAMRALAAILVLSAGLVQVTAAAKPLKVFILAGQSNMEGQAVVDLEGKDYNEGRGTLVQLMRDPAKAPMLQHLKSAEGQWVTRDDVWVRYQRERGPLLAGPLTFGFSVYGDRHHFGPELQFGHVIGDRLENQVLLIKTAWGGKSLYTDFRPPSSGGEVGKYFTLMLAQVREALANLETDFPGYDGGGYELAGFVWYHGWNDGVNPKTAVPAYETNLVNLIHDVRKELNAPRLPVVIGELTGPWVKAPVEWTKLRQAQAAAAARPEFKGNVLYVETHEFVRKPEESPNPGHGHHEFGNAETYFLVGDALGKGMLSLLRGQTAARHQTNTIEGWTVLVNERLPAEDQAATAKALELLRVQLQEIVRAVPAPAVAKLREVTLWFSPEYPGVKPRAEYHPGAGWLRDNGRDPAMVKGVEFTDVRNFEAETKRMPNFTLHELAHAYHDRVLPKGFANPDIQAAFERAKAGKSYDRVERWFGNGRPNTMEKAYAMNSPMEYFAETTEAFFSRNDFFPFTRAELKQHDPEMEQLLARLWAAASPSAGTVTVAPEKSLPPYRRMDFGPALFWTLQVAPGNIAQKGIAVRLDDGPGGVSKGRAWMTYDHDTMRVAAATTGNFVDWKGIAFDGSHGTHTGLSGERHFVNPVGPGWASPEGKWEDRRLVGRDQRRYGPLPREWAHYEGMYLHGGKAVIAANIGGTRVLESPGWIDSATPVFTRTLNLGAAKKPLLLRVAPDSINVALSGTGSLRKEGGFWIAELSGGAKARLFISRTDAAALEALARTFTASLDLEALTHGGPPRWPQRVTTTSEPGKADGAFIADTFPLPVENPWQSWMRPGGFDFAPDGKAAVVATWNGDVWRVDGLMAAAPSPLSWRRIASGLFQPLGVKFRGDELFITCRDQLVRLRDLNGDGETDFIENFNNDHQVTEHFHEFAMGLQTDSVGNFYYAKSGRHALDSVVPHHGTLLRVRADGLRTDILATGFRAANGVCLNDDGTFFVTDQEGFWTPKNRINRVKVGGFYGNMFGYTAVTNTSDAAMEQPMVWITNAKDRSPAELIWVPENAWGSLGGSLLNLSYGTGRAFIVPHEAAGGQWQGAVCELPMPAFATGIMRGRFAEDGALYACGLFGWAGNAAAPGGFHRIRRNEKPAHVPLAIHAAKGALSVTFSEPIDPASVQPDAFAFKVWSLKRSANYGSKHYDEHPVGIEAARPGADARTVTLDIPMLAPTQCYELRVRLLAPDGASIDRSLHGTIHRLSEK